MAVEIVHTDYPTNLLQKDWNARKCYHRYPELCTLVHNMEVYEDDIWIITLPKCGTTWMQELVWLILNNYDFETAKSEHLELRGPYLEYDFMINKNPKTALKPIERMKRPRFIKSHLPLPLLPKQFWEKKPKTIYVHRNLKDALVSMYYHFTTIRIIKERTLEEFATRFLNTETIVLFEKPFEHVTEFYQLRNEPWVFYTSYERMKTNLTEVIQDVCKFLGKDINKTQMKDMLHHLSFEEMKKNPKTNHIWEFTQLNKNNDCQPLYNFVREGKVNGYKMELTPDLVDKIDRYVEEKLKEQGVTLDELLLLRN